MTSITKWVATLGLIGLTLGGIARWTGSPSSIWLHLLEPWLLAVSLAVIGSLLLERQHRAAVAIAGVMVGGSLFLRAPVAFESPVFDRPRHLRPLKACTILGKPPVGPVRLALWTLDPGRSPQRGVEAILAVEPDIVVLRGTDRPGVAMRIQDSLGGEAKVSATDTGGLIAVTRGNFQYCGGEQDQWVFDLPSRGNESSTGVVSFPFVNDVGVVPLMLGQVAGPSGLADALPWSDRVHEGASTMAVAADMLGGERLVLVADFFAPPSAGSLARPLSQVGLRWAPSGPNWPQRSGTVLGMEQHPMDQVWVGSQWTVQNTRVLDATSHQRAPIVVDLIAGRES